MNEINSLQVYNFMKYAVYNVFHTRKYLMWKYSGLKYTSRATGSIFPKFDLCMYVLVKLHNTCIHIYEHSKAK